MRFAGFALAIFALLAASFVAAPVWLAPRDRISGALRAGGRAEGDRTRTGAHRALVVFEMALASTLLVSAMLLVKSFRAIQDVERGYREEGIYYTSIDLPFREYPESHRRAAFFHELLDRVRLVPGVDRASLSLGLPLDPRADFFVSRSPYSVEGRPPEAPGLKPEAALHVVGTDFFETLGVPLLLGRSFDTRDGDGAPPVVIVNQSFAARAWPGEDPVGKRLTHDLVLLPGDESEGRRVIGVVGDFRYYALEREAEPQMYLPFAQSPWPQMHLLIRSSGSPVALHGLVRDVLRQMDGELPLAPFRELSAIADQVMAPARVRARLLVLFACAAAVLAGLGLSGLMAFSVARRTRELALRVALGARRAEVLRLVFRQALGLALTGSLLGLLGAALSARLLSSLLFGVGALDPWSYGAMLAALLGVSFAAACVPARRATEVDPIEALRAE